MRHCTDLTMRVNWIALFFVGWLWGVLCGSLCATTDQVQETEYSMHVSLDSEKIVALCMGIGSKLLIDFLASPYCPLLPDSLVYAERIGPYGNATREFLRIRRPFFELPLPYQREPDAQRAVLRETYEELVRTLLGVTVKTSIKDLLNLYAGIKDLLNLYGCETKTIDRLMEHVTTGMLFTPAKNLMIVSKDLIKELSLLSGSAGIPARNEDLFNGLGAPHCNTISYQRTAALRQLNQIKRLVPEAQVLRDELLRLLVTGMAPFLGALFAEISFVIGRSVAEYLITYSQDMAKNWPAYERYSMYLPYSTISRFIHAATTVVLIEELKLAFHSVVFGLSLIDSSHERLFLIVMRLGEKLYIVLRAVVPASRKFLASDVSSRTTVLASS